MASCQNPWTGLLRFLLRSATLQTGLVPMQPVGPSLPGKGGDP